MKRPDVNAWKERLRLLGRRRLAAAAVSGVLVLAGAGTVGYALSTQENAPQPAMAQRGATQPDPATAPSTPAPTPSESVASPAGSPAPDKTRHASSGPGPDSIRIPAIGVSAPVDSLGLNPDGTMAVPQPGPHYDHAAWYKHSPRPGEMGPSVITGHIDSAENGPSVFFRLGDLRPGEKVRVTRNDGTTAVFAVDKVENYPKDDFPTLTVYGNTDRPELRLITCGGSFNDTIGHYRNNIVVFAHLVQP